MHRKPVFARIEGPSESVAWTTEGSWQKKARMAVGHAGCNFFS